MRLTPPLNLPALGKRRTLYFAFYGLAESCVLGKQSPLPIPAATASSESKSHHWQRRPLSRTYGAILSSSLAKVISSALGCSPHQPVSVLVRTPLSSLEGFPGSHADRFSSRLRHRLRGFALRIFLQHPSGLHADNCRRDDLCDSVTPSVKRSLVVREF